MKWNRLLTRPREDGIILFEFEENIKENIKTAGAENSKSRILFGVRRGDRLVVLKASQDRRCIWIIQKTDGEESS